MFPMIWQTVHSDGILFQSMWSWAYSRKKNADCHNDQIPQLNCSCPFRSSALFICQTKLGSSQFSLVLPLLGSAPSVVTYSHKITVHAFWVEDVKKRLFGENETDCRPQVLGCLWGYLVIECFWLERWLRDNLWLWLPKTQKNGWSGSV